MMSEIVMVPVFEIRNEVVQVVFVRDVRPAGREVEVSSDFVDSDSA